MRKAGVAAGVIAALLLPAAAAAHPGHSSPTVNVGGFAYSPATITIVAGDFVTWNWVGPDTSHSVTADPGQKESFDSDKGKSSGSINHSTSFVFPYFFGTPGTFTYHDKVNPSIRGNVVVTAAPKPPPSTGPRVAKLKAAVKRGKKLRVTFRLSESAGVTLRVRRAGSKRTARSLFRFKKRGAGSMTVSLKGLRPGRYSLTARAMNDAGKNSKTATTTFRLKAG